MGKRTIGVLDVHYNVTGLKAAWRCLSKSNECCCDEGGCELHVDWWDSVKNWVKVDLKKIKG